MNQLNRIIFIKKHQLEGDGDLSFLLPVKEVALLIGTSSENRKDSGLLCKPLPVVTLSDLQGFIDARL